MTVDPDKPYTNRVQLTPHETEAAAEYIAARGTATRAAIEAARRG